MNLLKCKATNFGSYEEIDFDFSNQGLTLIQGKTGSGKSTIFDLASWVLFGVTAKGGNVSDVLNWKNSDSPTEAVLTLSLKSDTIEVTRRRSRGNNNDLYWTEGKADDKKRGKDLQDTQKLLEKRLGVNFDLYSQAAYFNEFSTSSNFFLVSTKERRQVLENLADLSLPAKLQEKCSFAKGNLKAELSMLRSSFSQLTSKQSYIQESIESLVRDAGMWDELNKEQIKLIVEKSNDFVQKSLKDVESNKVMLNKTIQELEKTAINTCPTCGRESGRFELDCLLQKKETFERNVKFYSNKDNPYEKELALKLKEKNPYSDTSEKLNKDLVKVTNEVKDLTKKITSTENEFRATEILQDLSTKLRSLLLQNVISSIETSTNHYLTKFFDAEIKVGFELQDTDKLITKIEKSGYSCNYSQLSKGQRGLLKLCFALSIMEAASNQSGISFNNLFFDESLDGLDNSLKLKAFSLFEELSETHSSVFLIDHCEEFKNLFNNKYIVNIEDDKSVIEEQ